MRYRGGILCFVKGLVLLGRGKLTIRIEIRVIEKCKLVPDRIINN